ncbi:hypothetical protein BDV06DRAFT_230221 [Aspergillus oleicola]
MPSLNQVRQSNNALKASSPGKVAVFVGGTGGVGEEAAKSLARTLERPTIFLLGRNDASAARIIEEMKLANPGGSYKFFKCDTSLLKNVDSACKAIQKQTSMVDLLIMSAGSVCVPREDTAEGLEKNLVERYYSRMRFIHNLLPLLKVSESPRVISILLAGFEIELEDGKLEIPAPRSSVHDVKHAATMTSLAIEHLAVEHPSVSFLHVWPGVVKTKLLDKGWGWLGAGILWLLLWPFSITREQSGEYNTYLSTSSAYPPLELKESQDTSGKAESYVKSELGGGSYILDYKGDNSANSKLMAGYRAKGYAHKTWTHTLDIFQAALNSSC